MIERLIDKVVTRLIAGEPVPITWIFDLTQAGVDYSELEATYG
jgi:hypothetical protein